MSGLDNAGQVVCLGLSYRTAPIDLRQRLTYSSAALEAALSQSKETASDSHDLHELTILSTCNRLELYACKGAAADKLRIDPFTALVDFLVKSHGLPAAEFEPHLYRYTGLQAVEHLCRVASGLDSMILGESQILGQVAEAYEAAVRCHTNGPILSTVFATAIRAGKRARTESAIGRNPASLSSIAVKLAEQVAGPMVDCRAVIVGAGEMGTLALEALHVRGVREIVVVNRTYQRALELADRRGARASSLDQLPAAVQDADIVIVSTEAPRAIIGPALVLEAMARRPNRPLVLIDISVPRNVDAAVREIDGVHLFDIDQLYARLKNAVTGRQREIPQVETLVAQEVSAFEVWSRGAEMVPVITDLRTKAEHIRQSELNRTLRHLPNLDPETRQQIEHLSESLVNKLLHEPTRRLRAEASNGHAADYAQVVRHLFDLDD